MEETYKVDNDNDKDSGFEAGEKNEIVADEEREFEEDEGVPENRKLIAVEPALALYFMVLIPSMPLIQQFIHAEVSAMLNYTVHDANDSSKTACNAETNSSDSHLQEQVQRTTSHWLMSIEFAETFPSLLASLFFGPMSDAIGRKRAILAPLIGSSLKYGIYLIVMAFRLPLALLVLGGICDGLSGGQATILFACFAYIADCYRGKQRTIRMSILDVTFGVCGSLMMIAYGYFIKNHGFLYPFFLLIGMNILNVMYVTLFVPEARVRAKGVKLCSMKQLTKSFMVIHKPRNKETKWKLVVLILSFGCLSIILASRWSLQTLFVLSAPLCWSPVMIGYFRAYQSVVMNLGNIGLTIALVHPLTEVGLIILSCVSSIAFMVLLSVVSTTWMMFLVPVVGLAGFIAEPILKAVTAQQVPPQDLGALLAGIGVFDRICGMLGAATMMAIYGATLHIYRGFVFLVLGAGYVLIMLLMIYFLLRSRKEKQLQQKTNQEVNMNLLTKEVHIPDKC